MGEGGRGWVVGGAEGALWGVYGFEVGGALPLLS